MTVLLHAFPLDGGMWGELPGSRLDYESGSLADWADRVAARIDRPQLVVGQSMGGYAALELARRHPDAIAALVLADTRAEPDDDAGRAARDELIAVVRRDGAAGLWARMAPRLFRDEPDAAVLARAEAAALRQPPDRLVAMLEALRDRADSSDVLSQIAAPTVVVRGTEDKITPPDAAARLADGIPGARLVEIPRAGHLPAMEQPDLFAAAVALVQRPSSG